MASKVMELIDYRLGLIEKTFKLIKMDKDKYIENSNSFDPSLDYEQITGDDLQPAQIALLGCYASLLELKRTIEKESK